MIFPIYIFCGIIANIMNFTNFLKGVQKELRVTTFPKQDVVINFTLFVVIFTAIMAVYLGALDLGFGEAVLKGINYFSTGGVDVNAVIATTTEATATSTLVPTSATSVPTNILLK